MIHVSLELGTDSMHFKGLQCKLYYSLATMESKVSSPTSKQLKYTLYLGIEEIIFKYFKDLINGTEEVPQFIFS